MSRAVVTVPGPLVSELGFEPALPADKVRALLQLRYGNATRLVVQYAHKEAFGIGSVKAGGVIETRVPSFASRPFDCRIDVAARHRAHAIDT